MRYPALVLLLPVALAWARQPEPGRPAQPVPSAAAPDGAPDGAKNAADIRTRSFLPSRHGLRFANSFRGSPLPAEVRASPLARDAATALLGSSMPSRFGLCGGMSAAALDLFRAERDPPAMTTPPAEGTRWYEYLHRRQRDSLGTGAAFGAKFIEWMSLPTHADGDCTASRSADELAIILPRLRAGDLVPLGLVYVRAAGAGDPAEPAGPPWSNHQVLAIGLDEPPDGADLPVTIRLYDPNFPGADAVCLHIWTRDREARRARILQSQPGRSDRLVRGLFVMPYSPAQPPDDLPADAPADDPGVKKN